jgi:hypothetical protein
MTKKQFKNTVAAALCLALLFGASACGGRGDVNPNETEGASSAYPNVGPNTEIWIGATDATYSEEEPDDESSVELEPGTMQAGITADGKNIFALLRFDLGSTWFAGEIKNARMFIKPVGETTPERLRIGLIEGTWDGYFSSLADVKALLPEENTAVVDAESEQNGWISLPLTDYVKIWLSGDMYNNGLAVFGEKDGEL